MLLRLLTIIALAAVLALAQACSTCGVEPVDGIPACNCHERVVRPACNRRALGLGGLPLVHPVDLLRRRDLADDYVNVDRLNSDLTRPLVYGNHLVDAGVGDLLDYDHHHRSSGVILGRTADNCNSPVDKHRRYHDDVVVSTRRYHDDDDNDSSYESNEKKKQKSSEESDELDIESRLIRANNYRHGCIRGHGLIRSHDGLIRTTDGLIRTNDGLIRTTNGLVRATDGLIRSPDGLIRTSDGLIRTHDGLYHPQGGEVYVLPRSGGCNSPRLQDETEYYPQNVIDDEILVPSNRINNEKFIDEDEADRYSEGNINAKTRLAGCRYRQPVDPISIALAREAERKAERASAVAEGSLTYGFRQLPEEVKKESKERVEEDRLAAVTKDVIELKYPKRIYAPETGGYETFDAEDEMQEQVRRPAGPTYDELGFKRVSGDCPRTIQRVVEVQREASNEVLGVVKPCMDVVGHYARPRTCGCGRLY